MNLSKYSSKTWPNFNGRPSKGINYQGGYPETLKKAVFEFVRVEDYSSPFIRVFHYEIIDSRSTIFKDGSQEPYPGRSDTK